MMVSKDHTLYVAAKHSEHKRSPRSHELVETSVECAQLFFSLLDFVGDRSGAVILQFDHDTYSLPSWLLIARAAIALLERTIIVLLIVRMRQALIFG